MSLRNPQSIYGGLYGFFWLMALAIFFMTGSWIVFLLAGGISAILGAMAGQIMAGLGSMAFFRTPQQQPPQRYYQPPQPPAETYQEGGQQYPYPAQEYEQPQAQYPQQMPPQQ